MPSEKVLEIKKQQVAELKERFNNACAGVIVDYKGINVADDTALRKELREAGVNYTVTKNTLIRLAIDGTSLSELEGVLEGTTAIATSDDDYTAAARILNTFAEKNKNFSIKGGFIDEEVIDLDKLQSLAKLPTREVLLATVCNAFNAPIAAFARVIQAIVDKSGEEVPEAKEEAPAEEAAEAPAEEAAEAPAEEAAEAPAEETAEAPAEETAEAPAEETPAE
ncbi:MAG: 50S ribosomal protein L10 [Ruminococcaceae bacterium]|nr:50S ribosomal protein L10 [Oscillospiraceae bacterium]